MDDTTWSSGAWPRSGFGPREGLPPGLRWPSRRGASGGPATSWDTRSGAYRRVGAGLWVPSEIAATPEQRIVEAAAQLPRHGGVTGWAGLRWLGGRWFDGTGRGPDPRPVTLALGTRHSKRPTTLVHVSQELVPPAELGRHRGVRITSALWSTAFEMRKAATDRDALVAFEMAAYDDLVSIAEMTSFVDTTLWIRQGVPRVRELLGMLDENSWSPMESVMRWWWCRGGFPRPLTNRPVFDLEGRFVGTPDLLDVTGGVYGLYDGALHLAGEVRHGDVVKEAAYRTVGLEGVTMMAGDVAEPEAFLDRVRQAYARAARVPASERRWLLSPPPWWVPTFAVAQRRALTSYERSRFLGYRRAA